MELDKNYSKWKKECDREYIGQLVGGGEIKLIDVINCGSFGDIYLGQSQKTGEYFAVKFNRSDLKKNIDHFMKEFQIMYRLEGKGLFPRCRIEYAEKNYARATVLIMDHLGPNLHELFKLCNNKFTAGTVGYIAIEIIKRLKELHAVGIVHRDMKPENFCLGGPTLTDIYLIDFGLSKDYVDDEGQLKPLIHNSGFVGTPRYASRYAHLGWSQSRRDDIEALGYMCIFLLEGSLPWQKIKIKEKKLKHRELNLQKTSIDIPTAFPNLPKELLQYIEDARDLEFDEEPPYSLLINTLKPMACAPDKTDWQSVPEVGVAKPVYCFQRQVLQKSCH